MAENPLEKFIVQPDSAVVEPTETKETREVTAPEEPTDKGVTGETAPEEATDIFKTISQHVGREVKTWEELKTAPQPTLHYASEEAERFDKYARETGRGINDFMALNKNWSEVADRELVIGKMQHDYPTLSPDEVSALYDEEYGAEAIDRDLDEAGDIARKERKNHLKEIQLKKRAGEVRQELEEEKKRFHTPLTTSNPSNEEARREWEKSIGTAIDALNVEVDDFKYDFNDKKRLEYLKDVNHLFDPFRNEEGAIDFNKFVRTMAVGLENENILREYGKKVKADTMEEMMRRASNATSVTPPSQRDDSLDAWRQKTINQIQNNKRKF